MQAPDSAFRVAGLKVEVAPLDGPRWLESAYCFRWWVQMIGMRRPSRSYGVSCCSSSGSGILLKRIHPPVGDQRKPSPESQVLIVQMCVMSAGKSGGVAGSGAPGGCQQDVHCERARGKLGVTTKMCRSSAAALTSLWMLSARVGSASHSRAIPPAGRR